MRKEDELHDGHAVVQRLRRPLAFHHDAGGPFHGRHDPSGASQLGGEGNRSMHWRPRGTHVRIPVVLWPVRRQDGCGPNDERIERRVFTPHQQRQASFDEQHGRYIQGGLQRGRGLARHYGPPQADKDGRQGRCRHLDVHGSGNGPLDVGVDERGRRLVDVLREVERGVFFLCSFSCGIGRGVSALEYMEVETWPSYVNGVDLRLSGYSHGAVSPNKQERTRKVRVPLSYEYIVNSLCCCPNGEVGKVTEAMAFLEHLDDCGNLREFRCGAFVASRAPSRFTLGQRLDERCCLFRPELP